MTGTCSGIVRVNRFGAFLGLAAFSSLTSGLTMVCDGLEGDGISKVMSLATFRGVAVAICSAFFLRASTSRRAAAINASGTLSVVHHSRGSSMTGRKS